MPMSCQLELFSAPTVAEAASPEWTGTTWFVWSNEIDMFMDMPADLAAKYQCQGALVVLADRCDDEKVYCWPTKSKADYAEPEHDAPPFGDSEIVWEYRAAEFLPEFYGEQWERTADWLRPLFAPMRPEDVAESLSRRVGRWGGGYDLERAEMERTVHYGTGRRARDAAGHAGIEAAAGGNNCET